MFINSAIILPLKESFSDKDFGAVSIWVDYYLKYTKKNNDYVFCRQLPNNYKYLNNKVIPVTVKSKLRKETFQLSKYIIDQNMPII